MWLNIRAATADRTRQNLMKTHLRVCSGLAIFHKCQKYAYFVNMYSNTIFEAESFLEFLSNSFANMKSKWFVKSHKQMLVNQKIFCLNISERVYYIYIYWTHLVFWWWPSRILCWRFSNHLFFGHNHSRGCERHDFLIVFLDNFTDKSQKTK